MRMNRSEKLLNTIVLFIYVTIYVYAFPAIDLYNSFSDETDFYKVNMKAVMVILGIALTLALVHYRLILTEKTKNTNILVIGLSILEFVVAYIGRDLIKIINEYTIKNGSMEGVKYYERANILLAIVLIFLGVIIVLEMFGLTNGKNTNYSNTIYNVDREHWSVRVPKIINILLAVSTFIFPFRYLDIALYEGQIAICLPFCVWLIVLLNEFLARGKVVDVIFGLLSYILIIRNIVYYVFFNDEMMIFADRYVRIIIVVAGVEIIFIIINIIKRLIDNR